MAWLKIRNAVPLLVLLLSSLLHFYAVKVSASEHQLRGYLNQTLERQLQSVDVRDFKPLSCNSNLSRNPCSTTWSSRFGASNSHTTRIIIPCGECIVMDHASGELNLAGGIDIIGKLVFPNNYRLALTTTTVIVQGELQMTASKQVDGVPNIKFTLVGTNNDLTFTPVDVNANACRGISTCAAGKKSIVVAGGKITVNGLPANTPAWTRLYDVRGGTFNNPDTIVVPLAVRNRWTVGAQVLVTSHTYDWEAHQVRTIVQVTSISGLTGYVGLKLNETIVRPTTLLENADFAVEVALLSRNILFEGARDDTNFVRHGAHFMVFHTPTVVQNIQGVEFRNFGQQGLLGRYPIHFHHCGDVSGSLVSKNTIYLSNQRCINAHGTHKLRIMENVAFNTKGHCYITEDGIEKGNEFIMNLGAQTGPVVTLIPNNPAANNGDESDNQPATFWITNPANSWVGNVAAGSRKSGYWFEPLLRGTRVNLVPEDYDPEIELLTLFKDNVVHSTSVIIDGDHPMNSIAFRTYTPGYLPEKTAVIDGLKAYRNAVGINIHTNHRIHLTNSLFADNWLSIDIERSEAINVTNTIVIGESDSYRQLMARQAVPKVCLRNRLVGMELGTWQNKMAPGHFISNVTFSNFNNVACPIPKTISFDPLTLKQGIFETMSTFQNIQLPDGPPIIDMCIINNPEFEMIYINDLNTNLRPSSMTGITTGSATIIASENNELLKFVDTGKCVAVPSGCYSYCRDTCFRSLRVQVTGRNVARYQLQVCVRGSSPANCIRFKAGSRAGTDSDHTIMAHLPVGLLYDAVVIDGSTGQTVVPTSQAAYFEENFCGTSRRFGIGLTGQVGAIPFVSWTN